MGRNKKRPSRPDGSATRTTVTVVAAAETKPSPLPPAAATELRTEKPETESPPSTAATEPPTATEPAEATELSPETATKQKDLVDITELGPEGDSHIVTVQAQVEDHDLSKQEDESETDPPVDILGNGLITKKVLTNGLGRETRPNHGDVVTVSYKCWLDGDGTLVEDVSQLTFTLGDGDVIHAFDLAVPLAELKERFELEVDARFAYGTRGREPDIPGNAKLRYHIELLSCDDPPRYASMSSRDRLTAADQKRERGNYYYRREEYAFAVNSYNKALKILSPPEDNDVGPSETCDAEDCSDEVECLTLKLHNNLAATQLKIQAYEAAIKSCDVVLRKEPQNFKALFRKGKALVGLCNVDEAIPVLKQVLELVPHSPMVASELQRARDIQQKERERWSRAASRMFPHRNHRSKEQQSRLTRSARLRSIMCSRWVLVISAILFGLISIGLALYSEQFSAVSIPWARTESS